MSGGRSPDWELKYFNKETQVSAQVGVAWSNDNGSLTLKLNPCVVLSQSKEAVFTLFPWNGKSTYKVDQGKLSADDPHGVVKAAKAKTKHTKPSGLTSDPNDDIPF